MGSSVTAISNEISRAIDDLRKIIKASSFEKGKEKASDHKEKVEELSSQQLEILKEGWKKNLLLRLLLRSSNFLKKMSIWNFYRLTGIWKIKTPLNTSLIWKNLRLLLPEEFSYLSMFLQMKKRKSGQNSTVIRTDVSEPLI